MLTKKTLLSNLSFLVISIVLAVGLSYVSAAGFIGPTAAAPGANTETPINVSPLTQIKDSGDCTAGNCGGLSVNAFSALQNAAFDGDVYANGVVYGGRETDPGVFTVGDTARPTDAILSAGLYVLNRMKSADITSTAGSALCSDANGVVVKCAGTGDMCSNIAGIQTTVPTGSVQAADGTCTVVQKRFYSQNTDEKDSERDLADAILHASAVGGTPALIGTLGINNDNPRGWQINDIPGIQGTDDNNTTLLSVFEKGTYSIKIHSEGRLGVRSSNQGDQFHGGVDFYLKINGVYTSLVPSSQKTPMLRDNSGTGTTDEYGKFTPYGLGTHEAYPLSTDTQSDFSLYHYDDTSGFGTGGSGKQYIFTPYKFDFNKTVSLNAGDTVEVVAYVYASTASRSTIVGINDKSGGDPVGFLLTATSTIFDVTKTQ